SPCQRRVALSRATSTGKASASTTCRASSITTAPRSTRAKANAGSAPRRKPRLPDGEKRCVDKKPRTGAGPGQGDTETSNKFVKKRPREFRPVTKLGLSP